MTVTIMPPLTQLQILGLAPDPFVIKNAYKEVDPLKWSTLARSDAIIWGEYPRPNGVSLRVKVNLDAMTLHCTCSSLKKPCRYIIALLLLLQREPERFEESEKPIWVTRWLSESRSQLELDRTERASSQVIAREEYQNAVALMQSGMTEFARWLRDMVGEGLAKLPERAKDIIDPMVDRLYDANANQIASDLRLIVNQYFPKKGSPPPSWPEQVLRQFGRFYLITQAWERFDQLTKAQQIDLVVASGMHGLLEYDGESVDDTWLVVGRRYEVIGKQTQRRIWLQGLTSGRSGMMVDDFGRKGGTIASPITGFCYPGAVHYALPQAGMIGRLGIQSPGYPGDQLSSWASAMFAKPTSIDVLRDRFSINQTKNPWLVRQPAFLTGVYIRNAGKHWYMVDENEAVLRMKHRSMQEWYLFAHSLGRELTLFGELRQDLFEPLSIWEDGVWQDLLAWGHL